MRWPTRLRETAFAKGKEEKGQAGIELLIVMPVFFFIFLLVIDFGLVMYQYVTVSNAVREAARYGSVSCAAGTCTETDIVNRAITASNNTLVASDLASPNGAVAWVSRDANSNGSDLGDSVVVKAKHSYSMLFVPGVTIPVVSCADMRLERKYTSTIAGAASGC